MKDKSLEKGRYAYPGLERTMHEKARLGILNALLNKSEGLLFGDIKELCELTDGNLSRHLKVLKQEELIEIHKSFHNDRPQTLCVLTEDGKKRFASYMDTVEAVLKDAKAILKPSKPRKKAA